MEFVKNVHYTEAEKDTIINITIKYKNIIENKRTDGISNKQKNFAWDNIAKEYNALGINVIRTSKQLRTFYDNLKKRLKRQCADEKVELYKTGGGVMKMPPIVPAEEKFLDSLKETFNPLSNPPIVPAEEKFLDSLKETFNPLSNAYDSKPQLHEVNSDDNGDDLYNMTDHDYISSDTVAMATSSKKIGESSKAYTSTPTRKRTLCDVYEEVSSFSNTKKKHIMNKEDYITKCNQKKLEILSLEKEIKEIQKKNELEKHKLEVEILKKNLMIAEKEEEFRRKEQEIKLILLQSELKKQVSIFNYVE
ncbi:Myb/SANT-like DNA-binding domain [Popillia japonica]|uniref:Regulatory protein zeste n=1 Tax=Popillia japonica TaxID=7064 RepID=A0AAW1LEX9_POPJA